MNVTTQRHEQVKVRKRGVSRRGFLHTVSAGALAAGTLTLRDVMSLQAAELRKQGKSMILLWMGGGPSQFETFDPKPNHANGGETKAISTSVSGIQIAQGWEKTAAVIDDLAIIRSMTNKEGSHPRATYQMHTGYIPSGSVKHPSLAASIAKEISDPQFELPAVVSVGQTQGAGFLGVQYEPFMVQDPSRMPQNVATGVPTNRYSRRLGLLDRLEDEFADRGGEIVVKNHRDLYGKTSKMVLSSDLKAFDISDEPTSMKEMYGDSNFGRGCMLARRLVEAGTTFVEISSRGQGGNWDTHDNLYERVGNLSASIDPATAGLVTDLKDRGLLENTLVVWMGEFGRTPRINPRGGRDHYPRVFNAAMAGCGIKGGQVIGSSTADGTAVADDPVTANDLFCTICKSLDVDPRKENMSPLGRPMKIVDGGAPVEKLFA
ncbi:MAG: DUF1501 domain-containing protein [Planctomycetaceae bacterium]|jgi:hypothetical protein|nr:DUF1501 domain-containing protein [Planctomycetaceae bacterium]